MGVGRLVSIKNWWFSGSMFIYHRVLVMKCCKLLWKLLATNGCWWFLMMNGDGSYWLCMVVDNYRCLLSWTCNSVELTCRNPDWQGLCWLVDGPTEATEVLCGTWFFIGCYTVVSFWWMLYTEISPRKMKIHQHTPTNNRSFFLRLGMSLLSSLIFSQILLLFQQIHRSSAWSLVETLGSCPPRISRFKWRVPKLGIDHVQTYPLVMSK